MKMRKVMYGAWVIIAVLMVAYGAISILDPWFKFGVVEPGFGNMWIDMIVSVGTGVVLVLVGLKSALWARDGFVKERGR